MIVCLSMPGRELQGLPGWLSCSYSPVGAAAAAAAGVGEALNGAHPPLRTHRGGATANATRPKNRRQPKPVMQILLLLRFLMSCRLPSSPAPDSSSPLDFCSVLEESFLLLLGLFSFAGLSPGDAPESEGFGAGRGEFTGQHHGREYVGSLRRSTAVPESAVTPAALRGRRGSGEGGIVCSVAAVTWVCCGGGDGGVAVMSGSSDAVEGMTSGDTLLDVIDADLILVKDAKSEDGNGLAAV